MMEKIRTQKTLLLLALARNSERLQSLVAADAILKSVLHGIRDNLSLNSAIEMLTALPPYLKEIFVLDWKPSQNGTYNNGVGELLKRIYYYYSVYNFPPKSPGELLTPYKSVKMALKTFLSDSDFIKIEQFLPEIECNEGICDCKAA